MESCLQCSKGWAVVSQKPALLIVRGGGGGASGGKRCHEHCGHEVRRELGVSEVVGQPAGQGECIRDKGGCLEGVFNQGLFNASGYRGLLLFLLRVYNNAKRQHKTIIEDESFRKSSQVKPRTRLTLLRRQRD